ncbi:hypothetical protein EYF80_010291 [Liparis tanakae]|uniref:Uncharacterized protein n=1 Tax=Liparis tanakae TaxID=230148 RepID=A0A4Z2INW1_9TELE|nr:hypothetical protein EYF80_010291 [Liparis tanakae]
MKTPVRCPGALSTTLCVQGREASVDAADMSSTGQGTFGPGDRTDRLGVASAERWVVRSIITLGVSGDHPQGDHDPTVNCPPPEDSRAEHAAAGAKGQPTTYRGQYPHALLDVGDLIPYRKNLSAPGTPTESVLERREHSFCTFKLTETTSAHTAEYIAAAQPLLRETPLGYILNFLAGKQII